MTFETVFQDPPVQETRKYLDGLREFMNWSEIEKYLSWIVFRSELAAEVIGLDTTTEDGAGDLGSLTRHEMSRWLPFMYSFCVKDIRSPEYQKRKAQMYEIKFSNDRSIVLPEVEKEYAELKKWYKGETHGNE